MALAGESWLRLPRLEASHSLSVDVEFLSFSPDGVLLYSQQQEDGSGDFVSLALVNGHVEFRYNLGSGTVVLRSAARLSLHAPHRVAAKRYHRDGMLSVDDAPDVTGQSQGSLRALDLGPSAWVGGVPTNHSRYVVQGLPSTLRGFHSDSNAAPWSRSPCHLQGVGEHRHVAGLHGLHPAHGRRPAPRRRGQRGGLVGRGRVRW